VDALPPGHEKEREMSHASFDAMSDCKNLDQSYGQICVKCNRCGRFATAPADVEKLLSEVRQLETELAAAKAAADGWGRLIAEHNMQRYTVDEALAKVAEKFRDSMKLRGIEEMLSCWFGKPDLGWNFRKMSAQVNAWKESAVQWVTYTGEPETLPEEGEKVLLCKGANTMSGSLWEKNRTHSIWIVLGDQAYGVEIGDRWTSLPAPPQADPA
jgi:hypothetical protein